MKYLFSILLTIVILLFSFGCETNPVEITATGNVAYIGPNSGLPGNCEWFIMRTTNHGPAILAVNGPATAVGYQIRNGATIYFQDRYVGPNGDSYQYGSYLPLDTWLEFNYVIFKSSFSGWLWPIADFWIGLNDTIVESSYQWQVKFVDSGDGNLQVELAGK